MRGMGADAGGGIPSQSSCYWAHYGGTRVVRCSGFPNSLLVQGAQFLLLWNIIRAPSSWPGYAVQLAGEHASASVATGNQCPCPVASHPEAVPDQAATDLTARHDTSRHRAGAHAPASGRRHQNPDVQIAGPEAPVRHKCCCPNTRRAAFRARGSPRLARCSSSETPTPPLRHLATSPVAGSDIVWLAKPLAVAAALTESFLTIIVVVAPVA